MAGSIQFRGVDSVVEAYESRNVIAWSLWQGKQFMFKFEGPSLEEGAQQLQSTLELLAQSSNAIYTLKVYEDLPGGKIKSNTPDDGSFNFKLNLDEQLITQGQYTSLKNSQDISARLAAIEQKLSSPEEEEDEDEPQSRLGLIGEIISHPTIQPLVQTIITSVLGIGKGNGTTAPPQIPRAAINGINDESILQQAIAELKKHDGNLAEHLAKLATIAKENPQGFQFLITTLDSM